MPLIPTVPAVGAFPASDAHTGTQSAIGIGIQPSDTNPTVAYLPWPGILARITLINIANVTGSAATCRIVLTDTGTGNGSNKSLFWDVSIPANTTVSFNPQGGISMIGGTHTLYVRSGTGSALTFWIEGIANQRMAI